MYPSRDHLPNHAVFTLLDLGASMPHAFVLRLRRPQQGNEDVEQLVRPSRTSPIDLTPRGADLTAAQRLARGLPLNVRSEDDPGRHRERDIRSGGTARYTGTSRGHFDREDCVVSAI